MRYSVGLFAFLLRLITADQPILHDYEGWQAGKYGSPPNQTYHSSNITSPLFNYNTWEHDLVAGDDSSHILLGLHHKIGGPYLFRNDDLSLVYADEGLWLVMNVRVQTVKGVRYLSFWHGSKTGGFGAGFCVFLDDRYQVKYNVTVIGTDKISADFHECQVTPSNSVLLTAYKTRDQDMDSCFQEIDLETNALLFSWCASEYFDIALTFNTHNPGMDIYHINSVQKTSEGHYLTSLRALKLITYINGTSGEPIWNLGGKINDFRDVTPSHVLDANPGSDGAVSFGWQHTPRFVEGDMTKVAFFDNHNTSDTTNCFNVTCSRGRILQIDTSNHDDFTVQLLHDYRSPQGLLSRTMGSMQVLDDHAHNLHNVLISWGSNPEFTEYTMEGTLVRDVQYSQLVPFTSPISYRVYKNSWYGYPKWPPSLAFDGAGTLWVSWNGATEVKHWTVYGSDNEMHLGPIMGTGYDSPESPSFSTGLQPLQTVRRSGFETGIVLDHFWPSFVKVAALDVQGNVVGTSETLGIGLPALGCQLDCISLLSVILR